MGVVLAFAPGLLDPFVAPKQALLLLGGSALSGAILAAAIAGRPRVLVPRGAFEWLVVAGLVLAAAATFAGVSPIRSLLGEPEQREGLVTLIALGLLALASVRAHCGAAERDRTLTAFLWSAVAAAAYALIQHAGLDPIAWANPTHYPAGTHSVVRPAAALGNAILLGVVLAPALTLSCARLLARPERVWILAPATSLLAAATLATLSRGVWLGAAVGVGLVLPSAVAGRWGNRGAAWRALALGCAPAILWAAVVLRAPILARLAEGSDPSATSAPARAAIAQAALAIARSHPVLGSGPDTFGLLFPQYQPAAYARDVWLGTPAHAHSAVLQALATLGILGVLGWIAFGLVVVRAARAHGPAAAERTAITAALLSLAVIACVEPLGLAGAALLAVLAGLGSSRVQAVLDRAGPTSLPAIVPIGAFIAALACSALVTVQLRASAAAGLVRARIDLGVDDAAAKHRGPGAAAAEECMDLSPYDDTYARLASDFRLEVARRLQTAGDPVSAHLFASSALAAAERAAEVEPLRATAHQRVGIAEAMLADLTADDSLAIGHRDAARSAFAQARRLAPHDPMILVASCRAALTLRSGDWALAEAESLRALSPRSATAWALRAAALLTLGNTAAARAALDSAAVGQWEAGSERERTMVELARRTLGLSSPQPTSAQGSPRSTLQRPAR